MYQKYYTLLTLFTLFLLLYTTNISKTSIEAYSSIAGAIEESIKNDAPIVAYPDLQIHGHTIDSNVMSRSSR